MFIQARMTLLSLGSACCHDLRRENGMTLRLFEPDNAVPSYVHTEELELPLFKVGLYKVSYTKGQEMLLSQGLHDQDTKMIRTKAVTTSWLFVSQELDSFLLGSKM
jgi:hypothetical protein